MYIKFKKNQVKNYRLFPMSSMSIFGNHGDKSRVMICRSDRISNSPFTFSASIMHKFETYKVIMFKKSNVEFLARRD